jgi:hypothetical protein
MNEGDFFRLAPEGYSIFSAIDSAVSAIGDAERRISKSQIAFYRKHPFAAVWLPNQYLLGEHPPLVLSIFLRRRDRSPRWKEVVQPRPARFTHHLEISRAGEVDDEVKDWLREAWLGAM